MEVVDWILLIFLVLSVIRGLSVGLIRSIGSLVNLAVGVWAGCFFSGKLQPSLAEWMPNADDAVIRVVAFLIIVVVAMILVGCLIRLVDKLLKALMLGWINRLLGGALHLCICAFVLSLALNAYEFLDKGHKWLSEEDKTESQLYGPVLKMAPSIFPSLDFEDWQMPDIPDIAIPDSIRDLPDNLRERMDSLKIRPQEPAPMESEQIEV